MSETEITIVSGSYLSATPIYQAVRGTGTGSDRLRLIGMTIVRKAGADDMVIRHTTRQEPTK